MIDILSHTVEFRNGESGQHVLHIRTLTELSISARYFCSAATAFTPSSASRISYSSPSMSARIEFSKSFSGPAPDPRGSGPSGILCHKQAGSVKRLDGLAAALDLEGARREVEELEEKTNDPNFWNDVSGSQKVLQRTKQPLRPAGVHPVEHLAPVLGLGAAGAGVEAENGVAAVVLAGEQSGQIGLLQGPLCDEREAI